jgi:hypothetical protein
MKITNTEQNNFNISNSFGNVCGQDEMLPSSFYLQYFTYKENDLSALLISANI